jgi:hypothetical protein
MGFILAQDFRALHSPNTLLQADRKLLRAASMPRFRFEQFLM